MNSRSSTTVVLATVMCGVLLSCKSDQSSTVQPTSNRPAVVAEKKAPLLSSSMDAFNLVSREFDDGRIRLTPSARAMGLERGSGMTGLPPGTPGERCDANGCVAASCPSGDEVGITIELQNAGGHQYDLGYCVNRYTGAVNAFNDEAFSLTMKGNHTAWNPI